jgi:hypothetical protein
MSKIGFFGGQYLNLQQAQSSDTKGTETDGGTGRLHGSRVAVVSASAGNHNGCLGIRRGGSLYFGAGSFGRGGNGGEGEEKRGLCELHCCFCVCVFWSLRKKMNECKRVNVGSDLD